MSMRYYIGVDVGTASVRAALVDKYGSIVVTAEEPIEINNPKADFYEQSSDEIWMKCCRLIKAIIKNVSCDDVRGIGFDATCSLVILDANFTPLPVYQHNDGEKIFDIIMWMDHRASKQAQFINSGAHEVLRYVGGKISLEMQPPKLLWLKQNLPDTWKKAAHFFDLSDFLTFKATGCLTRSLCSTTCKWTYLAEGGWSKDFWKEIGLEEIVDNGFTNIGEEVVYPGTSLGNGLSPDAALNMNLPVHIPVAASLLDAHCGGIGVMGGDVHSLNVPCTNEPITERIAFICGTSSCHMAISENPLFVPGVWGPYYSAMIPNLWLNEGGQSATGNVIDHVVQSHPAYEQLKTTAKSIKKHVYESLNNAADHLAESSGVIYPDFLTQNLHVSPDYHGNRSPLADPRLCGAMCGVTLDESLNDLAKQYIATVQSLACGSKHIVETLESCGHKISTIFMCGGLSKNPLFVQIHANVLGRPIVLGKETEAVLLGAAILGAYASKDYKSIPDAMEHMCRPGRVVQPNENTSMFYEKKYQVFLKMTKHQIEYREIMAH